MSKVSFLFAPHIISE